MARDTAARRALARPVLRLAHPLLLLPEERHGLPADPLHDASALPDLVGLRVTGSWTEAHLRLHLPRLDRLALAGLRRGDPDAESG